ncbi:hypothetical protein DFH09DRAFT_1373134 [Mycena vulgaris]|nr:hypothetical protein DFH09DRAFT_1373134 [Mycena vulgaris]
MPSKALTKALANTENWCILCQITPNMNTYQAIATLAFKVSVAVGLDPRGQADSLAAYTVKKTGAVIKNAPDSPLSPEVYQALTRFKSADDMIGQHIGRNSASLL